MANDDVFVMGHAIEDIDSFGSAVGIYRIAKALGKKAHVVINEVIIITRPAILYVLRLVYSYPNV